MTTLLSSYKVTKELRLRLPQYPSGGFPTTTGVTPSNHLLMGIQEDHKRLLYNKHWIVNQPKFATDLMFKDRKSLGACF